MSIVRNWAAGSAIAALILLTPVIAFLIVLAAEVLIDCVIEARVAAICIAAACVISWFLFHRRSIRPGMAIQSRSEEETGETAIAAPPT
jgi:hypothetical protein